MLARGRRGIGRLFAPAVEMYGAKRSERSVLVAEKLDPLNLRAMFSAAAASPNDLEQMRRHFVAMALIRSGSPSGPLAQAFARSRSQLLQDLFVQSELGWMRGGVFVEVGVGDGESLSNSYLLEKEFGWSGLLAEASPRAHASIRNCRTARLETRAVYSASGLELEFVVDAAQGELSSLLSFAEADGRNRAGEQVVVQTVTLDEALSAAGIEAIDYLSVDTEGSELEVLEGFDIVRFAPKVVTVEHNYDFVKAEALDSLLLGHGYERVLEGRTFFDAWYVHPSRMG